MPNLSFRSIAHSVAICAIFGTSLVSIMPAQAFKQSDVDRFIQDNGSCVDCDLTDADFNGEALFYQAFISNTDARRANFSSSQWSGLNKIEESDFSFTNFNQSVDISIYMAVQVSFVKADFTEATFSDGDFENCDFTGAKLISAILDYAIFSDSTLPTTSAIGTADSTQPSGTSFVGATFTNATVNNSSFIGANFSDADFSGANFKDVDLTGSNLSAEQLGSLASFSGTLPDGTIVASTPEPSTLFGLLVIGGLSLIRRSCLKSDDSQDFCK